MLARIFNPKSYTSGDIGALGKGENAVSASRLASALNLVFSGDVAGSVSFRGDEGELLVDLQTGDDTHSHVIENVDGLTAALDEKMGRSIGLNVGDDLNDISQEGLYAWSGSVPANSPMKYAAMIVQDTGRTTQIVWGGLSGSIYIRRKNSGTWSAWSAIYSYETLLTLFSPLSHMHDASEINAGILAAARMPAGSSGVRGALKRPTHTTSMNSYFKCNETGKIWQKGYTTGTSITFPIAFPNTNYSFALSDYDANDTGGISQNSCLSKKTASGCTLSKASGSNGVYWIAEY